MPNNKYKLVVFDLDGTLIDSLGLIASCIKQTAKKLKVTPPTDKIIHNFISCNTSNHLLELFPTIDRKEAVACYKWHYFHGDNQEQLFPGTLNTLSLLQQLGFTLAISTNRNRSSLEKSLQAHQLAKFFSTTRSTDDGYVKPQPEMILTIIKELDIHPNHTVMVGDATCDMLLAQNAGIDAIAVNYGLNSKDKLSMYFPVASIDHIEQLLEFIT